MINKMLILFGISILLVACANTDEPLIKPEQTPIARFNFPAFTAHWGSANVRLGTKGKRGCGELSANLLPDGYTQDFIASREADSDIFFHIERSYAQNSCTQTGMFYAIKDHEYTINFDVVENSCVVTLMEKAPSGTEHKLKTYPAYLSKADGKRVCLNKDNF